VGLAWPALGGGTGPCGPVNKQRLRPRDRGREAAGSGRRCGVGAGRGVQERVSGPLVEVRGPQEPQRPQGDGVAYISQERKFVCGK